MDWIDIASIVFICVTSIHLGLIDALITTLRIKHDSVPVLTCPKCLTWWSIMGYGMITFAMRFDVVDFIHLLAISFLGSYTAIWVELFEGFIDTLYLRLYGKITSADNDNEATASADDGNSASTLPKL